MGVCLPSLGAKRRRGMQVVTTAPFDGQKPGTRGLRKRVKVFQQPHYTENFVQAILSAIPTGAEGSTLVVGGDGRYFGKDAIQIIIKLASGNLVNIYKYNVLQKIESQRCKQIIYLIRFPKDRLAKNDLS
jgi:hypothetical protein